MAVPLVNEETSLGVLQVLDRSTDRSLSLSEIDLLIYFANQASIGLDLLQTARRARAVAEQGTGAEAVVARLAALLEEADEPEAMLRLLEALEAVLPPWQLCQPKRPGGRRALSTSGGALPGQPESWSVN